MAVVVLSDILAMDKVLERYVATGEHVSISDQGGGQPRAEGCM